jgi:glycosyltransferase involved in cell wall biosynthesis
MRVALCLDQAGTGGTETQALKLARALGRRGVDVRLLIGTARGDNWEALQHAATATFEYSPSVAGPARAAGTLLRIARAIRRSDPHVLHAFDMYSNVLVAPVARLLGVPRVICSKRWMVYDPPRYETLNRMAMRAAHLVIGNGEAVRRSLTTVERVEQSRTAVLPNALDEAAFEPTHASAIAPEQASRILALRGAGFVMWTMTARLVAVKEHRLTIAAIAQLRARRVPVGLVLVGDGPLRPALEAQVADLGVGDVVVFCGQRPPIPNPAFLGDGVIMSSSSEGMPNAVTEGMAAARPIVATDVGSARELVESAGAGLVVPPGNVDRLVDAIARLTADEDERRACGARALRFARREHHIDAVCEKLLTLYADE